MWALKSAESAFKSWTMVLGMLIGGVTVFNFMTHALHLGLREVFRRVLDAYHAIFHTLFDWLTFWIPFHFEPWMKDIAVIWFVLWGALARIIWLTYRLEITGASKMRQPRFRWSFPIVGHIMDLGPPFVPLAFLISLFLWPLILGYVAITTPYFLGPTTSHEHFAVEAASEPLEEYELLFDVRVLYFIQIAMMVVVACTAIVANDLIN